MPLLASLVMLCTLSANPQPPPAFPGGILDTTERTAYLASEAGIDAVDLHRGEVRWQSPEAHLPLLVAGDRLYALAVADDARLAVVGLDLTKKGARVLRADVPGLPRWAVTRADPAHHFRCAWRLRKNVLVLDWEAAERGDGGPAKHTGGQAEVDLETGRVATVPVALGTPRTPDAPAGPLEKLAIRWHGRAGGQLLAVVAEDAGERRQRLVLRSWDARTGKPTGAPRELVQGGRPVVLRDLDATRLWLRDAADANGHWAVVAVLDGLLVTRVPVVPGTHTGTIVGTRAYLLTAAPARAAFDGSPKKVQTLHAVELDSGKVLWQRSLGVPAAGQ